MEKYNILLSFPRSGNTWLRYITEYISKSPTCHSAIRKCGENQPDKHEVLGIKAELGIDINKKAILVKRHRFDFDYDSWSKDNCRLVIIVRDYKEAILRHALAAGKKDDEHEINKCIENYIHCLESYDKFDGDKILIYYEDLMRKPREEIERLADFLDIKNKKHIKTFFQNFKMHKNKALRLYKPGSITKGRLDRSHWFVERTSAIILNKIKNAIQSTYLYDKYLTRYD